MARRRIVLYQADLMVRIMQGDLVPGAEGLIEEVSSDCPDDMRIVGCGWDEKRNCIRFAVESGEFDEVADGMFAPEWTPTYSVRTMSKFEAAMAVLKGE